MTGSILPFRLFPTQQRSAAPPLLFVEMFQEHLEANLAQTPRADTVVANCRTLIRHARACGIPVGIILSQGKSIGHRQSEFRWIEEFRPQRSDMVFELPAASCYSSAEFADAISDAGNQFVMAGFLSELVCLSTAIDAAAYGHRAALIDDATASRPIFGGAEESHRVVVGTASRYATIFSTANWLAKAGSQALEFEQPRAVR